jgi:hypothetical protein
MAGEVVDGPLTLINVRMSEYGNLHLTSGHNKCPFRVTPKPLGSLEVGRYRSGVVDDYTLLI